MTLIRHGVMAEALEKTSRRSRKEHGEEIILKEKKREILGGM
jgi:hypothetical protein